MSDQHEIAQKLLAQAKELEETCKARGLFTNDIIFMELSEFMRLFQENGIVTFPKEDKS